MSCNIAIIPGQDTRSGADERDAGAGQQAVATNLIDSVLERNVVCAVIAARLRVATSVQGIAWRDLAESYPVRFLRHISVLDADTIAMEPHVAA
eukprot:2478307-Rhodomonas_salina.2